MLEIEYLIIVFVITFRRNLNKLDKIVFMENGEILFFGDYVDLVKKDYFKGFLAKSNLIVLDKEIDGCEKEIIIETTLKNEKEEIKNSAMTSVNKQEVVRLTKDEESETGSVKLKIYTEFIRLYGGYGYLFIILICI